MSEQIYNISDEKLYRNRELSWLDFNRRVLAQAQDETIPIFERLKFTYIFSNNLDEFYMLRIGMLMGNLLHNRQSYGEPNSDKIYEVLAAIHTKVKKQIKKKDMAYTAINKQLANIGIKHLNVCKLTAKEKSFLHAYFLEKVKPFTQPMHISKTASTPFLENKKTYIAIQIHATTNSNIMLVPAFGTFEKIIYLPGKQIHYILAEELIWLFAEEYNTNVTIIEKTIIRITRNAYMDIQQSASYSKENRLENFEKLRESNKHEVPVRLEFYLNENNTFLEFLRGKLMLKIDQVYHTKIPLDLSFILDLEYKLKKLGKNNLFYSPLLPQETTMCTQETSILTQVQHKDILISYPFESIDTVFKLLEEAIVDEATISIKLSLYRLASDSKFIAYLIEAAKNGKETIAIVELRAKMDEQNNIQWAKKLIDAGVKVVYGIPDYKVHSKMLLITRKINNELTYITNIGTGNYNETTAEQYTDLSLITANQSIGSDVDGFFTSIINEEIINDTNFIITAPVTFKPFMLAMIEEEIQHAKNNKAAQILIKVNAITDREIINKLIEASQYGVIIRLIVRGISCLRPGVRGYTHNITLTSVVGRYLEHSRIYCFGVGERQRVFLSSSDLMVRNTQRRIEVAVPIYDAVVKARLLQIFHVIYMDNVKANIMLANGKYRKRPQYGKRIDSQLYLYALSYYWANGGEFSEIYEKVLNGDTANVFVPMWKKILNKIKNIIGL